MSERAAGDIGEDLLDDSVVAVLSLGLDQLERRIGEDRVVAPDGDSSSCQRELPCSGPGPGGRSAAR
jgi:hypothetical protein